jgi:RimJ/RimL family protein N-acetyltransferase
MDTELFKGRLVRLAAQDPAKDPETIAAWDRDTEYKRLLDVDPVVPPALKAWRERLEHPVSEQFFPFGVRTLADDTLIGFVVLMRIDHVNGNAWVGIGMGNPDYRGKGYGTDAMNVALKFAFQELNLHRVSLEVLASNARAIRSYEKCGFVVEGQTRGTEFRDHIRANIVSMGILRSEWERRNREASEGETG